MKRLIAGLLLVGALTACTPNQQATFQAALAAVGLTEDPADDAALKAGVDGYLATRAAMTAGRPCAQWYDAAIEAGWSPEEWPTISRVMYRESMCTPTADNNSSSARGLMQILDDWIGPCGITYADLHDPLLNLRCALHIERHGGGWSNWVTY